MKQTAVVIAPGRGTYNSSELGYLATNHADASRLAEFDDYRKSQGQPTITELDSAPRFSKETHMRGDNAAALIYACAYSDFTAIDRDSFDIVGITGNSMGWYIALACAGALDPLAGLTVANTMGRLMHEHMIGGQLIYPLVDEEWREVPGRREELLAIVSRINASPDRDLGISIDLGGMLVLAGNEAGLSTFEKSVPRLDGRYPLRLPGHSAFHTQLQKPVSDLGFSLLSEHLFKQPETPLIDGRGAFWHPRANTLTALYSYTLGHQVSEAYDYATAIRTAARDLMPDVFIILGPGNTLGGATAQALIKANWRGWETKSELQNSNIQTPRLLSMGDPKMRKEVTR
ncbi:MAG: ACP S-malonyltransferase [Paracoccaceae bacterium]|nr:ACP S-malonyltransferase [Paracoccaceae bacterium]MDG2260248.1 ACP S-malonyltransferase [Paracoccaceae bacterium]